MVFFFTTAQCYSIFHIVELSIFFSINAEINVVLRHVARKCMALKAIEGIFQTTPGVTESPVGTSARAAFVIEWARYRPLSRGRVPLRAFIIGRILHSLQWRDEAQKPPSKSLSFSLNVPIDMPQPTGNLWANL